MSAWCLEWVKDAVLDFRKRCPQRTLLGRASANQEALWNNVVLSALNAALLQVMRDDQQAIIRVCEDVCDAEQLKQPVQETWRRKVQYYQNTQGICPVSADERKKRKAKELFVRKERERKP